MAKELLARRSQYNPSAAASEETQTKCLLKRLDLLCDSGLREIEGLGGSCVAEILSHSAKDFELMHGEIRQCISCSGDDPFLFRHANLQLVTIEIIRAPGTIQLTHGQVTECVQHPAFISSISTPSRNS